MHFEQREVMGVSGVAIRVIVESAAEEQLLHADGR